MMDSYLARGILSLALSITLARIKKYSCSNLFLDYISTQRHLGLLKRSTLAREFGHNRRTKVIAGLEICLACAISIDQAWIDRSLRAPSTSSAVPCLQ
jgi:hypothetical protein